MMETWSPETNATGNANSSLCAALCGGKYTTGPELHRSRSGETSNWAGQFGGSGRSWHHCGSGITQRTVEGGNSGGPFLCLSNPPGGVCQRPRFSFPHHGYTLEDGYSVVMNESILAVMALIDGDNAYPEAIFVCEGGRAVGIWLCPGKPGRRERLDRFFSSGSSRQLSVCRSSRVGSD